MLRDTAESMFKVGQVWNYRTRPQETESTLTVVKVEADPTLGVIVHINLQNLRMRNPLASSGYSDTIAHSPISEEALKKSVTSVREEVTELPRYEEGYREWRAAFDAGRGGVFTLPVEEVVDAMETVLNQQSARRPKPQ